MIKKLRRRMILINMLLVGTVILAIFIAALSAVQFRLAKED